MASTSSYDYIIIGTGLAGLSLATAMAQDSFFKDKSILLLDKQDKTQNDRTWCYWRSSKDPYESIIAKKWTQIRFKSTDYNQEIDLSPYSYNKIEATAYYKFCFDILKKHPNIIFKVEAYAKHIEDQDGVTLYTAEHTYHGKKLFSSIPDPEILKNQEQHQVLYQHFIGWFIKTEKAVFDPEVATFMDFSIPQRCNTRFMYVLPTSPTKALLEYTLFSEHVLEDQVYERGIKNYLKRLKIDQYTIINKESGVIPMTVFPFEKQNSRHSMYIGTAGGWTRASTGYTFTYTQKRTAQLLDFIKKKDDFRQFRLNDRYRWYDRLFLDVLYRKNKLGSSLFQAMFLKNPVARIFKFLDGESSLTEDLKIIWSLPKKEFIKALCSKNKPR